MARSVWGLPLLCVWAMACGGRADKLSAKASDAGGTSSGAAGDDTAPAAGGGGDGGGGDGGGGTATMPVIPILAFQVDAFPDPGGGGPRCEAPDIERDLAGPWLVALREIDDGRLEGAIVSRDSELPDWRGSNAWPLQLEPRGDHYVTSGKPVPLKDYYFGSEAVPGVCLGAGTRFTPIDDDGDGVADRLDLTGTVSAQLVSSDFSRTCPDQGTSFEATGAVVARRIELRLAGDALRPRLELHGGLLAEGTAVLETDGIRVGATALTTGGFIHAFEATESVAPGSVRWRVSGPRWVGAAPQSTVVDGEIPEPSMLGEGDFEDIAVGRLSGDGEVAAELTCCEGRDPDLVFPAIGGARSLKLPLEGGTQLLQLRAPAGMNRLTFVGFSTGTPSYGSPWVEVARVGSRAETYQVYVADYQRAQHRLAHEPADCAAYADICAYIESESQLQEELAPLERYSLDLPEGDGDVLLRVRNMGISDSCGSHQLWLDDFRLE